MAWFDTLWPGRGRRLDRLQAQVRRLAQEVERLRCGTTLVLGPDRAVTEVASGVRLYIDPRDRGCGMNLAVEGRYEEDELRVLKRFLRPGGTFLDVGANYGYYALSAAPYLRPGGRAIGFEPNPHVHALFAASIYLNSLGREIEARQLGASDRAGTVRFDVDDTGPGGAHVAPPGGLSAAGWRSIEVAVAPLDEQLPADLVVDAVKIDVEGHEEQVLRGMRGIIARSPGIAIAIEFIHAFFADEAAFARFAALVTGELGLRVYRVLGDARLEPTDFEALRGAACNLLLVRAPIAPLPDLAIRPVQLHCDPGAERTDEALHWRRGAGAPDRTRAVAQGPHLFLPRGRYRVQVNAAFEGRFLFRLQEGEGDLLLEEIVRDAVDPAFTVHLAADVRLLDIAVLATRGSRALTLRSVEFWPE